MSVERDRVNALADAQLSDLLEAIVRELQVGAGAQSPTPLAGVGAARLIAERAHREIVLRVRRAREAGHAWDEIGEALNLTTSGARTRAETAFELAVGRLDQSEPSAAFEWRCAACDSTVTDLGPYNSKPQDDEVGHAEACQRLAAETERCRLAQDHEDGMAKRQRPRAREGARREPDSWSF